MPSSITDIFKAQLGKYIVFFKADIQTDTQWQVSGILTKNALEKVTTHLIEKLVFPSIDGSDRFECWHTEPLVPHPESNLNESDWFWLDMAAGIPELAPEISEAFIPQMLNLDNYNAINFKKGCFTGQEIIARMRYLGKLKKRMTLLESSSPLTLKPGSWLLDQNKNKIAHVVRSLTSKSGYSLTQAVLSIEIKEKKADTQFFDESGIALRISH